MTSQTSTMLDLMGGIKSVERPWSLGMYRKWKSVGLFQELFFKYYEFGRHLIEWPAREGPIDYIASQDAPIVNKWMAERDFTMVVTDRRRSGDIYVGSVNQQLIIWRLPDSQLSLNAANGCAYQGALLNSGISFYDSPSGMVAAVATTGKNVAYFMPMTTPSGGVFELMNTAQTTQNALRQVEGYGELSLPCVDLSITNDAEWLRGANTISQLGRKVQVAQALQKTVLKMNYHPDLKKGDNSSGVKCERSNKRMEFVSPFLFWVSRPDIPFPMFTAWVDYPEWEKLAK